MKEPITAILVPQGAEYRAVCRGLSRLKPKPLVLPIPVGPQPLTRYLESIQAELLSHQQPQVLLMGLCGSLVPHYSIGQVVLYQQCIYGSNIQPCSWDLTALLHDNLQARAALVRALTSDRVICSAAEKRQLGKLYAADVVDMEGFAALDTLTRAGVAVAMLRVVSDDCHHDLPDLSSAFNSDGSLQSLPLALGLIRQPIAATRLIGGALQGLQVLQQVTTYLFMPGSG